MSYKEYESHEILTKVACLPEVNSQVLDLLFWECNLLRGLNAANRDYNDNLSQVSLKLHK